MYRCPDCDTSAHDACAREMQGCGTLGCGSQGAGHRFELSPERREQIRAELRRELRDRVRRTHDSVMCDAPGCTFESRALPAHAIGAVSRLLGLSVLCEQHGLRRRSSVVLGGLAFLALAAVWSLFVPQVGVAEQGLRLYVAFSGVVLLVGGVYYRFAPDAAPEAGPSRSESLRSTRERVRDPKAAQPSA